MSKIDKSFLINFSPKANNLIERTIEYFEKSGFKMAHSSKQQIEFTRGSFLGNLVVFNPLKWKSKIVVVLTDIDLKVHLKLKTTGQMVTEREIETWKEFIDNYESFLNNDQFDFQSKNDQSIKKAHQNNVQLIKWTIVGMLIGLVPGILLAWLTGYSSIATTTAMAGGAFMLVYKARAKK